jgi:hypothetical protein
MIISMTALGANVRNVLAVLFAIVALTLVVLPRAVLIMRSGTPVRRSSLLALALVLLSACTSSAPAKHGAKPNPGGWIPHRLVDARVLVWTPPGWELLPIHEPAGTEPATLFAAGDWRFGSSDLICIADHLPAIGVFIQLLEWQLPLPPGFPPSASSFDNYPARPARFTLSSRWRAHEKACVGRSVFDMPFKAEGRFFYFQVTVGEKAPASVRRDVVMLINRLQISPA